MEFAGWQNIAPYAQPRRAYARQPKGFILFLFFAFRPRQPKSFSPLSLFQARRRRSDPDHAGAWPKNSAQSIVSCFSARIPATFPALPLIIAERYLFPNLLFLISGRKILFCFLGVQWEPRRRSRCMRLPRVLCASVPCRGRGEHARLPPSPGSRPVGGYGPACGSEK